jgi:hypothetical protein
MFRALLVAGTRIVHFLVSLMAIGVSTLRLSSCPRALIDVGKAIFKVYLPNIRTWSIFGLKSAMSTAGVAVIDGRERQRYMSRASEVWFTVAPT